MSRHRCFMSNMRTVHAPSDQQILNNVCLESRLKHENELFIKWFLRHQSFLFPVSSFDQSQVDPVSHNCHQQRSRELLCITFSYPSAAAVPGHRAEIFSFTIQFCVSTLGKAPGIPAAPGNIAGNTPVESCDHTAQTGQSEQRSLHDLNQEHPFS